ncbi:putative GMC oxidoreductase [Cladorrhinum samala]|uniref:GMC oxidoreductase n=1 Tax=Cladorrhinum samala TaxID=585594 RepID=A0AAV9I065_9PEZI|nr:putative GMC oxidoreductase [Cladorrhinum samala]
MSARLATLCLALFATAGLSAPSPQNENASANGKGNGNGNGNGQDIYDYIVVGSGPGGSPLAVNLAKAGYSVLLLEAGDDQSADISTQIISLGSNTATNSWNFWVRQYSNDTQQLRNNHLTWKRADGSLFVGNGSVAPADATVLGMQYPRGATLGGSSVINAGVAVLPSEDTWDAIGALTGDSSWSAAAIRNIFKRVENNHYVPPGTAGHGFSGYLDVNTNDGDIYSRTPGMVEVFKSMVSSVGGNPANALSDVTRDVNNVSPARDTTQGLFGLPFHANSTWGRFSARKLVLDTLAAKKPNGSPRYPLTLKTKSLVTKVTIQKRGKGQKPIARGVEYLEGQSLYSADPRYNPSSTGVKRTARARKEVILSGGVFNTPQLLQLSGIGPRADLEALGIPVVVDLPGVGRNMQDNQEFPVIGVTKNQQPFAQIADPSDPQCNFGIPPDPCVDAWKLGQGPYARAGANTNAFMLKTNHSVDGNVDFLIFSIANFAFRGYYPLDAANGNAPDPVGTFGMSLVKINPQNKAGTVKLRSANPRDTPLINFEMFGDAAGAETDLNALAEAAAWGRSVYANVAGPDIGPMTTAEPPCDGIGSVCVEGDKQWARDQSFGHHATSTAAIGADSDPLAVLDSKFRVRGVAGLRVVDGSAFPTTPGAFPVVPTFLISEKASQDILNDA